MNEHLAGLAVQGLDQLLDVLHAVGQGLHDHLVGALIGFDEAQLLGFELVLQLLLHVLGLGVAQIEDAHGVALLHGPEGLFHLA